jgi:hypothetical protein
MLQNDPIDPLWFSMISVGSSRGQRSRLCICYRYLSHMHVKLFSEQTYLHLIATCI